MATTAETRIRLQECPFYDDHFASQSLAYGGIESKAAVADSQPDRRSIASGSLKGICDKETFSNSNDSKPRTEMSLPAKPSRCSTTSFTENVTML